MNYFAPERLSENMAKTPEGFLMCYDVAVAREGSQDYAPQELVGLSTAISPGPAGAIEIARTKEELFDPKTLATLNGKDFVDEHPEEDESRLFDVDPENYQYVTCGTVLNPRPGKVDGVNVILCDLLVKRASTIERILKDGKREVSGGYRAQVFKVADGKGEQRNIFFNHVALVKAGRCGPSCSIRDHKCNSKEPQMAKQSWKDRLMAAFKTKDEEGFKAAMAEAPMKDGDDDVPTTTTGMPEIHVHNHMGGGPAGVTVASGAKGNDADPAEGEEEEIPDYFKKHVEENNARFGEIKDSIEALKGMMGKGNDPAASGNTVDGAMAEEMKEDMPEGTTRDHAMKVRDSANFEGAFQQMVADSEVILPGITVPSFVRDAAPSVTYPSMCKHRRTVLELAYVQPSTRGLIDDVLNGAAFDLPKMSCVKVRDMFRTVATAKRAANRAAGFVPGVAAEPAARRTEAEPLSVVPRDNVSFNAYASEYYKTH